MTAKLIILRGPSGAGKSTVARELQRRSTRKTAVIEQDYYREVMFKDKKESGDVRRMMLLTDCLIALEYGYDVILEGILNIDTNYRPYFDQLFAKHETENYMFYFDTSLEETIKRHAQRPKSTEFDAKQMKEWYKYAHKSDYEFEEVIPETSNLEATIQLIFSKIGI